MADVLRATYADLKTVKTRSTCQLILELPIEALTDVVALLGAPVPGNEVWVAVARLREGAEAKPTPRLEAPERKPAKLAQIAGILSNEAPFHAYVAEEGYAADADGAAQYIRAKCGVESRADIDGNPMAEQSFRDMKAHYEFWMRA